MRITKKGTLFLLPNLLCKSKEEKILLPKALDEIVENIDGIISESLSSGRFFLSIFRERPDSIPLSIFNKNTPPNEIDFLLEPMLNGENWALVSDCGLPCVADPGSKLVSRANRLKINVEAFSGPSSVSLALMLSGLPGQRFAFNGYLPKKPENRRGEILELEKRAQQENSVQIFIEAPHRNEYTLKDLLQLLSPDTYLSISCELTMPSQKVITMKIKDWNKIDLPNIAKKPTIFLIGSTK